MTTNWIIWCFVYVTTLCLAKASPSYEIDEYNLDYYNKTLDIQLSLSKNNSKNLLLPFNTTRVPGTIESQMIQDFIHSQFNDSSILNNWDLEIDHFETKSYNFTNIIYTLNPDAEKFIVLSAHYDSKIEPKGFIGGMDSAVPCSILLYVSKFIDKVYYQDQLNINGSLGLKIVFFDGEEAFGEWSQTDSLYGSRHLAEKWGKNGISEQIETFILLDLIGSKGEYSIPSYYSKGHEQYKFLYDIESAFLETNYSVSKGQKKPHRELSLTDTRFLHMNQILIDDDHAPFWRQGVSILHLIPSPFPSTWHTITDNFDSLDQNTIYKWAILMCEYIQSSLFE